MYQDRVLRGLTCQRVQLDEIWSFACAERSNSNDTSPKNPSDVWTWVAIDADTKLVPTWFVGDRSSDSARQFLGDLGTRVSERMHLTSDGPGSYLKAVDHIFGEDIGHAVLDKHYGRPGQPTPESPERYPGLAAYGGAKREEMIGSLDPALIRTSYVERHTTTSRTSTRRLMRLTNAFSKKVESYCYAIGMHFAYYNFVRIHEALRTTPAMAAGVTDRHFEIGDLITVLENWERSN